MHLLWMLTCTIPLDAFSLLVIFGIMNHILQSKINNIRHQIRTWLYSGLLYRQSDAVITAQYHMVLHNGDWSRAYYQSNTPGQLWGFYCEDFQEHWHRHNDTALYLLYYHLSGNIAFMSQGQWSAGKNMSKITWNPKTAKAKLSFPCAYF